VDAAGVATTVIDTGPPQVDSGLPPLLLLHGSGPGAGAVANWRLVLPDLARTRRVIAPKSHRVRRLVTMGTVGVAMPMPPGLDEVWGYTPSLENMTRVVRLFTDDSQLVTSDLIELRHRASVFPAVKDSWAAMFPPPRQRWLDDLALSSDELRALHQPTLLVHGRDDRVIPLASSLALLDLLPDVELHVFGGCGHWAMIERAPAFVALVTDFLGR
jgi:2-hydroxymuconate-semialdehyde hydrolase